MSVSPCQHSSIWSAQTGHCFLRSKKGLCVNTVGLTATAQVFAQAIGSRWHRLASLPFSEGDLNRSSSIACCGRWGYQSPPDGFLGHLFWTEAALFLWVTQKRPLPVPN